MENCNPSELYKIYYLEKYPNKSNAYSVSRSETWTFVLDKMLDNEVDAKSYVKQKNKYTPEFVLQSENVLDKDELLDRFCFSDEYLLKKRYFLEPLPTEKLKHFIAVNYQLVH